MRNLKSISTIQHWLKLIQTTPRTCPIMACPNIIARKRLHLHRAEPKALLEHAARCACMCVWCVCVCVCVCLVLRLPKDMGNDNVRVHLQMRCHACEEIAMANYICIIVCVHRPHNTDQRKQKQRQLENTSQLIAA